VAITYLAAGAIATGTTSATVAHPAGIASGDLEVMQVVTGHPSNLTPSTPAGWTKVAEQLGGDPAAYGVGAGPRRIALYTRIAAASNPSPVIAMPAGTNVFIGARMHALRRSAGTGWRYATSVNEDTSSGTGVSITGVDSLTWLGGDFAFYAFGIPTSTPTMSAEAITAASVTFGASTERGDDAAAVGGTARLISATSLVSSVSGSPVSPPVFTGTLSAGSFAVGAMLRAREALSTVTATVQSAFPPRILVAVEGMLTEKITSITIERAALNTLTPLRAAVDVDVTGVDSFVRTDGEAPFGVPVYYVVTLSDADGNDWQIISNTVTINATDEVLSDPILGIGVNVQIMSWREKRYERESTLFNVSGRLVVVSGPNPGATSDIVLFTRLTADHDAFLDLLNRATNGIVQLRTQAAAICLVDPDYDPHGQVDNYLAILSTIVARAAKFRYPQRTWSMSVAEVDPWPAELEAQGWTYADIDAWYTDQTYAAIDAEFTGETYLALDTFDWGV
jgi:hypothetical protein